MKGHCKLTPVHNPSHGTWVARATRSKLVKVPVASILAAWLIVRAELLPADLGELEPDKSGAFPRVGSRRSLARYASLDNKSCQSPPDPPPDPLFPPPSNKSPYSEPSLSDVLRSELGLVV